MLKKSDYERNVVQHQIVCHTHQMEYHRVLENFDLP